MENFGLKSPMLHTYGLWSNVDVVFCYSVYLQNRLKHAKYIQTNEMCVVIDNNQQKSTDLQQKTDTLKKRLTRTIM